MPLRTVLVSMPFLDPARPSIQLGLLRALGTAHGFDVRTLHANLDFAALIGRDRYEAVAAQRRRMIGEWLFSVAAFGAAAPDPGARRFAAGMADAPAGRWDVADLIDVRDRLVPRYLDDLVESGPWADVDVVGFTSTHQQNTASFALARRLKQLRPELTVVFGGANFDGEMGVEWVRTVDCIDLAVIGEADRAFPALLGALTDGSDPGAVPGVARRTADGVALTPPAAPGPLDDLPPPDYDEYFERAERLGIHPAVEHRAVLIPFESARGCWWGARHHCVFCGLNGTSMPFRSKSAVRVRAELAHQARRYRSFRFEAVDNILDMRYFDDLLTGLAADGTDYELFYEVKSNLSRRQVRTLWQAGVRHIQPGLESLSSAVLALMRKGVRAAQNVNLLRWARYYGIDVSWNVLYGFPGETAEDYAAQASAIPYLAHLQPPDGAGRIWMERFSPLFTDPDSFGVIDRRPADGYGSVYPPAVDLTRAAYFFDYALKEALPDDAYGPLRTAVDRWIGAWAQAERPTLTFWSAPGFLQIHDARHAGREGTYTFSDTLADIYLACNDRPTTAAAVARRLGLPQPLVGEAVAEFGRRGLMFLDGDLAVALALPATSGR